MIGSCWVMRAPEDWPAGGLFNVGSVHACKRHLSQQVMPQEDKFSRDTFRSKCPIERWNPKEGLQSANSSVILKLRKSRRLPAVSEPVLRLCLASELALKLQTSFKAKSKTWAPPQKNLGWPQKTWGYPRKTWGGPQKNLGGPRKTWGHPRKTWGHPRKTWGHPRKTWGGPRKTWGGPRKTWGGPRKTWGSPQDFLGSHKAGVAPCLSKKDNGETCRTQKPCFQMVCHEEAPTRQAQHLFLVQAQCGAQGQGKDSKEAHAINQQQRQGKQLLCLADTRGLRIVLWMMLVVGLVHFPIIIAAHHAFPVPAGEPCDGGCGCSC